jgi:secreted PhoX family phosphatase
LRRIRLAVGALALCLLVVATAAMAAVGEVPFGEQEQGALRDQSTLRFGVVQPLQQSSHDSVTAEVAAADPTRLVTLAGGLRARVVTSGVAGANLDQISFWPNAANPEWLIACNEEGTTAPGLQRIRVSDGKVETILSGTTSCDPTRLTPWGTILFGEEAGGGPSGGRLYELVDPINTTGVTLDRATGTFSGGTGTCPGGTGACHLAARPALGRVSFEGIAIYPNGVTYLGDENRPASGVPGGAYFKFVPATARDPKAPPITRLEDSPYAAPGTYYGLRLGLRSGGTDYGQGTELGLGRWVPVPAAADVDLRAQAAALKLTGYYRPEDADLDQAALAGGQVRFCSANTGNEVDDHLWGTVTCIRDGSLAQAASNGATPEVDLFVAGNPQFAMMDNVAYKPDRQQWVFHEDGDRLQGNNDLWQCLEDSADDDTQSDGCIRIATLNDLHEGEGAEWTGGIFDATGTRFFVSVQHNVTGKGVLLEITGWVGGHQ